MTEIYCRRDHWKDERPFVNKDFHMITGLQRQDSKQS